MVAKKSADTIQIHSVKQGKITLRMISDAAVFQQHVFHAMRDLLIGGGKKTAAEKKEIKHNPEQEFRESVYTKKPVIPISASLHRGSRAQWLLPL